MRVKFGVQFFKNFARIFIRGSSIAKREAKGPQN